MLLMTLAELKTLSTLVPILSLLVVERGQIMTGLHASEPAKPSENSIAKFSRQLPISKIASFPPPSEPVQDDVAPYPFSYHSCQQSWLY